jgi:lysophospholipase L1-like esterase
MPEATGTSLPRVLLIGDSITKGYGPEVEKLLNGKAYVARVCTSKAVGDPALPKQLAAFLTETNFDVIHFNVGMHGWAYSEDEYKRYLPELLGEIRKDAPNAKLIWANTTPVRKDTSPGPTNDRIHARNAIADEFFLSQGVQIDDLNALMTPHADLHTDDVHFKASGYAIAAADVAQQISKLLPTPTTQPAK